MGWWSYFYPQTIGRFSSRYNRDIRLVTYWGRNKLLVNGSPQSGRYIEKLWRKALRTFRINQRLTVQHILVLGVAGGSVIRELKELFPRAIITGVEIDAVMLRVGQQHFDLNNIPKLSLITADAQRFVREAVRLSKRYDLIVVDIFFGREAAKFISEESFLCRLRTLLAPAGTLLVNYLREKEYREKSDILLDKLKKVFHSVKDTGIFLNRFFCARA